MSINQFSRQTVNQSLNLRSKLVRAFQHFRQVDRDRDPEFRYKNFGIDKLFISDELYDELIETLSE
jgi:hypothetical protein